MTQELKFKWFHVGDEWFAPHKVEVVSISQEPNALAVWYYELPAFDSDL